MSFTINGLNDGNSRNTLTYSEILGQYDFIPNIKAILINMREGDYCVAYAGEYGYSITRVT